MRRRVNDALIEAFCRVRVMLMTGGDDRGTTMIEWALMATGIIVIVAVAVQYMFGALGSWFHWLGDQVKSFQGTSAGG